MKTVYAKNNLLLTLTVILVGACSPGLDKARDTGEVDMQSDGGGDADDAGTDDDSGTAGDSGPDAGTVTALAIECDPGDAFVTTESAELVSVGSIAGEGDELYVVDSGFNLRRYSIDGADGCGLSLDQSFGDGGIVDLTEPISDVEITANGEVVVATPTQIVRLDSAGSESASCDVPQTDLIDWGRGYDTLTIEGSADVFVVERTQSESFKVDLDAIDCAPEPWVPQGYLDMPRNRFEALHRYDGATVAAWFENDAVVTHLLVLDDLGNTTTRPWAEGLVELVTPDYRLQGLTACTSEAGHFCAATPNTLYVMDQAGELVIQRSLAALLGSPGNRDVYDLAGGGQHIYASVNVLTDLGNDEFGQTGMLIRIDADAVVDDFFEF